MSSLQTTVTMDGPHIAGVAFEGDGAPMRSLVRTYLDSLKLLAYTSSLSGQGRLIAHLCVMIDALLRSIPDEQDWRRTNSAVFSGLLRKIHPYMLEQFALAREACPDDEDALYRTVGDEYGYAYCTHDWSEYGLDVPEPGVPA